MICLPTWTVLRTTKNLQGDIKGKDIEFSGNVEHGIKKILETYTQRYRQSKTRSSQIILKLMEITGEKYGITAPPTGSKRTAVEKTT